MSCSASHGQDSDDPRLAGLLVAVDGPLHLLGFGLAQLLTPALWPIAILGALSLGARLAGPATGRGPPGRSEPASVR